MKVTVVGAGNVGATCANVIAHNELTTAESIPPETPMINDF